MDEMQGRSRLLSAVKAPDVWSQFAGTHATGKLQKCGFVGSRSEAVRLGNMLMDSGFLHHAKHSNCFEDSSTQFFFDEDHIALCQPLIVMDLDTEENPAVLGMGPRALTRIVSDSSCSASLPSLGTGKGDRMPAPSRSSHALMEKQCACRRLGQRITTASASRHRFRRKFKVFTAENMLTARLLADDHASTDFAAFAEPAPRRARTFGAAEMA